MHQAVPAARVAAAAWLVRLALLSGGLLVVLSAALAVRAEAAVLWLRCGVENMKRCAGGCLALPEFGKQHRWQSALVFSPPAATARG